MEYWYRILAGKPVLHLYILLHHVSKTKGGKIMKKKILYLVGGVVFLIGACTPIEDRQVAGPVVPATDFKYTITNDAANDYILYLDNKTSGVMFSWDYAWGVTRKQNDTVRTVSYTHLTLPTNREV